MEQKQLALSIQNLIQAAQLVVMANVSFVAIVTVSSINITYQKSCQSASF